MKIGILTLPLHSNYGGVIQNWALQQIVERYGHTPYTIEKPNPCKLSLAQKALLYPFRLFRKLILRQNICVRREDLIWDKWHFKMCNIAPFISDNINRFEINDINDIRQSDFDCYIIGSDQVWRPEYAHGLYGAMENAFGWFAKEWNDIKVFSYAASFGIDNLSEFSDEELNKISKLKSRLSGGVSVREQDGIRLCRQIGFDAHLVLDPTLLLQAKDYLKLLESYNEIPRKGLMTYILDNTDQTDEIVGYVAGELGLEVFSTIATSEESPYSVEQWLAGFRDADFVLTDSFHATVFSIIFKKPFAVILNSERGTSRIQSLLENLRLTERIINNIDDIKNTISNPIDYDKVNLKLNDMREKSFKFLEINLFSGC